MNTNWTYLDAPIVCEECHKVIEEHSGYTSEQYGICNECYAETEVRDTLACLRDATADYPADLLAARRAAFVGQIENHNVLIATGEGEYKITPDIQGEK